QVDERLGRHSAAQGPEHRQAADAGVEDADWLVGGHASFWHAAMEDRPSGMLAARACQKIHRRRSRALFLDDEACLFERGAPAVRELLAREVAAMDVWERRVRHPHPGIDVDDHEQELAAATDDTRGF